MKMISILFLMVSCVFNSFAQTQQDGQTRFTDEEYKVWSEIWCSLDAYLNYVNLRVIQTETLPMTISLEKDNKFIPKIRDYYVNAKLPDMTNDLVKDFNVKNDRSYLLERNFVGCKNYVLVTKTDISSIFKYPNSYGIRRFSRIGLSPNKKQAVIFLKYSCGFVCGSGDYYFFVKEDGEWVEKIVQNVSLS